MSFGVVGAAYSPPRTPSSRTQQHPENAARICSQKDAIVASRDARGGHWRSKLTICLSHNG